MEKPKREFSAILCYVGITENVKLKHFNIINKTFRVVEHNSASELHLLQAKADHQKLKY